MASAATVALARFRAIVRERLAGTERRRRTTIVVALAVLVVGAVMTTSGPDVMVELRLLDASGAPLTVSIDGGKPVFLPNVAVETPDAGTRIRLWPGRHELVATAADGTRIDVRTERFVGGGTYLYVPVSTEQCFWVQHDAYGEAKAVLPPLVELEAGRAFYRLPGDIDAWFVPNPPPSTVDRRSSGGTRTAVRMARCGLSPWR
jgi:hypothetical protein